MEADLKAEAAEILDTWGAPHKVSHRDITRLVGAYLKDSWKDYDSADWDGPEFEAIHEAVVSAFMDDAPLMPHETEELILSWCHALLRKHAPYVMQRMQEDFIPEWESQYGEPDPELFLDNAERARDINSQ